LLFRFYIFIVFSWKNMIRLHNSLSRKVEDFIPLEDNLVRIYSCGPTVYNYAHIGNMRAFLFADLLQRVLRIVGAYKVKWVMNITNIDDKTIRDSAPGSRQWLDAMGDQTQDLKENLKSFTDYFEKSFIEDISKLGIELDHFFAMPRATEFIESMKVLVKRIVDNGYGYISGDSVYFDVKEWRKQHTYGRLFKIDFDNFRTGERIDADQYERDQVSDFVLWKGKKEGEPFWEFELNGKRVDGRPGWHIECSCMEQDLLGLPFDIHTGGVDLKFPHHEDEIAQSHAGYGIDPTVYWMHNEFLEVEGSKMSKTLGNFFTLRELIEKGIDPLDVRFAMFSVHYGSKYNFTFSGLEAARKARFRIQDYIYDLFNNVNGNRSIAVESDLKVKIYDQLANDLHTPKALGEIFTFINQNPATELNSDSKKALISLFNELNGIFNVWSINERKEERQEIPENIIELAENRLAAKKARDFALSDSLRNEIIALGYSIKDTKDSYEITK